MSSDSDNSVELVYDSGAPHQFSKAPKKMATVSASAIKVSSPSLASSCQPPALTHYRCIKFPAYSEIELVVRKWHCRSIAAQTHQEHPEATSEEPLDSDFTETLASLRANNPPAGTVYFTLLSGRAESFGIQLVLNRLYTINFGARFVAQTFHGCELCFMIRNPDASFDIHAKYMEPPAYRPKNLPPGMPTPVPTTVKELRFVPLSSPGFTSYNVKNESVDLSALMPLIRLDSGISSTGERQSHRVGHSSESEERWRLACNVKQFGKRVPGSQKLPNWVYQSYVHLAVELNRQRKDAAKANRQGPNVIIVGPCDSGKSTLAKILINYAINEHWSPYFVDLDVGQGAIAPGTIGAGIIDEHCHLDQEFNFRNGYPTMVHFGGITPDSDKTIHMLSVNCLARAIIHSLRTEEEQEKMANSGAANSSQLPHNLNQATLAEKLFSAKRSQELRSTSPMLSNASKQHKRQLTKWSGLIINTCGWIFDFGYESTLDAIRKFGVSIVLVLGDYRLYERIHKDLLGYEVARGGGGGLHAGPNRRSNSGHAPGPATSKWSINPASFKVHFFQRNFSVIKRHSKVRRRMRMDRFARFFEPTIFPLSTVTIPFGHHPIFRFYSAENFSRFLREAVTPDSADQQPFQERNGHSWPPIDPKSVQPHSYWTCKVEKMASKDRRGPNHDQVIFYHLNRETLVYLMGRILSILVISIEQLLSHDQNWLSLRQLLTTRGFARVVQIDLEKECFDVELPGSLAPALRNGELVLLVTESTFDPEEVIN